MKCNSLPLPIDVPIVHFHLLKSFLNHHLQTFAGADVIKQFLELFNYAMLK